MTSLELQGSTESGQTLESEPVTGCMTDWRSEVYAASPRPKRTKTNKSWIAVRRAAVRRDQQKCQRCKRVLGYKACSVHHIIPRDEGGGNNLENLITLCKKCHDWVELSKIPLRSRAVIQGSNGDLIRRNPTWVRPDWHAIVYGGVRPRD